jgi:prepilin-type N-terminal cleavage/methylation domain-containing protein
VAPPLLSTVMPKRRPRSTRGVSLLEILIATAIFASLLGIGLPRLSRLRAPYTLSGATRQLQAALQATRMRAIARNVRYRVNFNTSAQTYTLEREVGGSFVADAAPQRLPKGAVIGTVSPGNPTFDTRGMLTAQVTVPVTVASSGTRTVTVNVLGKTTIN